MNCKTIDQKVTEAMETIKRFFLITLITVMGTAIFAGGIALNWTIKKNRELKTTIEQMEQNQEEDEERLIIKDPVTGRIIYDRPR